MVCGKGQGYSAGVYKGVKLMDDLISRQAAIEAFEDTTYTKNEIRRRITELPSAQPEIIRCKDCKFYTEMRTDLKTGICSLACRHLGDDGFCSEAERRTDET